MNAQERQLIDELFDRLSKLETAPRDADAEAAIRDGWRRAPNAAYALVQTVLVQDEALKRANAHIEDLQAQLQPQAQGQSTGQSGGFLDNMRDALFGHGDRRGSVPSVRQAPAGAPGYASPPPGPSGYGQPMAAQPIGSGGSFLGTAAASAAGVIGGAMLLGGIRSMFGHSTSGPGAYDPGGARGLMDSPWGGNAANSDLARQAGIDHIGDSIGSDRADNRDMSSDRAGFFGGSNDQDDTDNYDTSDDDTDFADLGDNDSDNA